MPKISIRKTCEAIRDDLRRLPIPEAVSTAERMARAKLGPVIECKPMNAVITKKQCRINQEKAAEFRDHSKEYFAAPRASGNHKPVGDRYKSKNWGNAGDVRWVDPLATRCIRCWRFRKGPYQCHRD